MQMRVRCTGRFTGRTANAVKGIFDRVELERPLVVGVYPLYPGEFDAYYHAELFGTG